MDYIEIANKALDSIGDSKRHLVMPEIEHDEYAEFKEILAWTIVLALLRKAHK